MGIIKGLAKIGAAVGVVKAGKKTAEHYRENNPEGVADVNGDGVVDYKDKIAEVAKAAEQTFGDVKEIVEDKLGKL